MSLACPLTYIDVGVECLTFFIIISILAMKVEEYVVTQDIDPSVM